GTDSGAGGGLTHTTLAGCNHENLGQGVSPLRKKDCSAPEKHLLKTTAVGQPWLEFGFRPFSYFV
ncbi:hypothetical protein, partial [Pseudomonas sp.]|uniref:hypothetical protein n=1 Tax=Pseudomonas sp. TaxID=306 RepID=UPI002352A427